MPKLVLIHGRAQQNKDATVLKQTWVDALHQGMRDAKLDLEIPDSDIRFPYYGDALAGLIGADPDNAAEVWIKGPLEEAGESEAQSAFTREVLSEILAARNVTDDDIRSFCDNPATEMGLLNWPWVLASLRALDSVGVGSWAVKLFTYDVFAYLTHPGVRDVIDTGVRRLFDTEPAVVVSHSLGTVVAYDLLRRDGTENKWSVPAFITLGSPLSVKPVAERLTPIKFPSCVGKWFTARDPLDTVALHPLSPPHFPDFHVTTKDDVNNTSDNHHGIVQYLLDPDVAFWIYSAMTLTSP